MRTHTSPSFFTAFLILLCLFCIVPKVRAQQDSAPAKPPANSGPSQLVSSKTQPQTQTSLGSEASFGKNSAKSHDDSDILRKRAEWFYRQRASVHGRIPAGAYQNAFQHLQRMLRAEGKFADSSAGRSAFTNPVPFPAWTPIGPTPTTGGEFSPVTGRVLTIAVDPSDASGNTVLLGGAMGGIWRSTNAGASWTAVGDQNASLAMGSIAFASNGSIVYAGTGEADAIGFDVYYGAGVLKSTDHGQTWTQTCTVASSTCPFIGPYNDLTPFGFFTLGGTRISYVSVNPTNSQMVLVGAETQFAEGTTEGVYCSDNGGTTWSNILPDELSSFVGFASSTVAYAALGNPFGSSQGAPNGNGIYKATGIGATCATIHFTRLTSATLPTQPSMGRIDIGIAPSDPSGNTLYASIADSSQGSITNLGVFLSSNGGTSWTRTNAPDVCQHQCWYDNVVKVDPAQSGVAFLAGGAATDNSGNPSWVVRSSNNGTSWTSIIPNLPLGSAGLPHVDNHALALVKLSTGKIRLYLGNDGGIWRTDDAEAASVQWTNLNNPGLTLTQFYPSISFSPSNPAIAFGGTQDNGSQNYQGALAWQDNQQCGDGGSTAVDALIPSTVYIGCITGFPVNASYQSGAIGTFFPAVDGINPADPFILPPLATDPNFGSTAYFGTTRIYQSIDAGNNWTDISGVLVNGSPDLLTAIAVAPGAPQVAYAGATNGLLFGTANLSQGSFANFLIKGSSVFPPRALTSIAIDPADPTGKTLYVAFSGFSFVNSSFSINDPTGHVFKSVDGAATFVDVSCSVASPANCSTPATADLPNIPVNDIVVDPDIPNIIYAATDLGVFIGNCSSSPCTWSTLGTGLPRVTVLSLRLHEPSRTLVAGTHGRGAWTIALNNFTFSGPHIANITPISANAGGTSLTLTVNGSGLTGGVIQFGGAALTPTGVSSDTSLSGTVPTSLLIAGVPQITVKVASQTSNAIAFSVLGNVPKITSLSPASTPVQANPSSSVPIQINGTGFSSTAKVLWDGAQNGITVAAATASCPLPTCLSVTLPANLLGPFGSTNDIQVSNQPPGGGKSNVQTFRVAAPPPLNDNFANAINITQLIFSDIRDSSGATTESSDPLPPTTCVQQFTSNQGNTGGQPNGKYNTIWYKFTPQFSAPISIDTIGSSYDSVISIWTGSQGSLTQVACNDDINPGIVLQSQVQNVTLSSGTTYYIMVSSFGPPDPNPTALGGKSQFNFFYNFGNFPTPTLTSVAPSSAKSGDPDLTVTLVGTNFFSGATVQFVNATTFFGNALATTFVSSTQLTAVIPASAMALPGPFNISVVNPGPNFAGSNAVSFTVNLGVYPVPTVNTIFPTTVVAGTLPFFLTVNGANFAPGAVINFNGAAKPTTLNSAQNAFTTIPAADITTAGTVQVTVTNPTPGGGTSAPQPFVITQPTVVPTINSVNPSSVFAATPTNITITGTGFLPGVAINTNGGTYSNATVISSTQLSVSGLSFPSIGAFSINVIDPSPAGMSAPFNMTATQPPPPVIISVSPPSAQSTTNVFLTITGTGFLPGASLLFNGIPNTNVAYISSTQLNTNLFLTGTPAGTYPLIVVDPAIAGNSAPFNFTVTPPPDFSITSSGTTTETVRAGATATYTNVLTVSPQNGFANTIGLTCSVPANLTQCSVNPPTLTSGSATVTVTTTSRGLLPPAFQRPRLYWPVPIYLVLIAVMLQAILLLAVRVRRFRLAFAIPAATLALLIALHATGCGGGSSSPPPPPPPPQGTPAGSYTITVTATSGNLTHTTTLTLVVN